MIFINIIVLAEINWNHLSEKFVIKTTATFFLRQLSMPLKNLCFWKQYITYIPNKYNFKLHLTYCFFVLFFFFLFIWSVEECIDQDIELDARFIVAASTVFLSMSLKIITEIVEYVRRNPEIINIIDRQLNEFMVI